MIEQCGVNTVDISEWTVEPWAYKNVTDATKWFNNFMKPVVNDLIGYLNRFPPSYFKHLPSNHDDVTYLRQKKRNVVEVWNNRPRYKDDKGRYQKGY